MNDKQPMPLKQVLNAFLDQYKLTDKYDESYIKVHWDKIMGHSVAKRTQEIYIKEGVMYLKLESSPMRKELSMNKSQLQNLINADIGKELVTDIVFL